MTTNVRNKKVSGNLIWWDTHTNRWLDGTGPDVNKMIEEFQAPYLPAADSLAGWTITLVEGGGGETTLAIANAAGGTLLITTDAAENDGLTMQRAEETFKLASLKPCYFGIRFKISEKVQSDFLVGLAITNTNPLGGVTDGVYFRKVDGAATVTAVAEKNSTETESATVHTMVDDTFVVLEFYFDGTDIHPYVDGVAKTAIATNIPDDEELAPVVQFLTGEGGTKAMTIDWIRAIQVNAS